MGNFFDLHRHDEFSLFDGFGRAIDLANYAKELGHTSFCTTNHGNTNGLIQTYKACKEVGLKAILGVEGYFLPTYKPQHRGYHLILIAKNLKGYGNLNRIQFEGDKQKYYNPIWTFDILERYSEGLICTSACISSYLSQAILKGNIKAAEKFILEMKRIFKDDFYIEIQPYSIDSERTQEKVNEISLELADKYDVKCILTSDSHRGKKEDLESYILMHQIAKHSGDENGYDIEATYGQRYMPSCDDIRERFMGLSSNYYGSHKRAGAVAETLLEAVCEIEDKCEANYLDDLPLELPLIKQDKFKTTYELFINQIKEGLKKRNKYTKEYLQRAKKESEVIKHHGFEDYFLIVADYVNWAKQQGIAVGPGRGSVCNCLVAYALGITEVDSLHFGLDFDRFLRKDKYKYPDIDLDFQTSRRAEVIEYICNKYEGKAARICSYGLYKIDNLVNDLCPHCNVNTKQSKQMIKSFIDRCLQSDLVSRRSGYTMMFDFELLNNSKEAKQINDEYNNILKHFYSMFLKVKYIGTHAAGVAIVRGDLLDYVALRTDKKGDIYTNYDLSDLEDISVMKFDILGLKTMESIADLRETTGVIVDYEKVIDDDKLYEYFVNGNCDGIFQFEQPVARKVLEEIRCDCFNDIVAASSMNRPGPLMQKLPLVYAANKENVDEAKKMPYYKYTAKSYGTVIYQEQIQQVCLNMGELSWADVDRVMKLMKIGRASQEAALEGDENYKELLGKFQQGAIKHGMSKEESFKLFYNLTGYTFNQGHGTGYSLISVEEMFYKVYYPNEYWFTKLKYAKNEDEYERFCIKASKDNGIIFLPHVNYSHPKTSLRRVEGENILQQGLSDLKNVGEKASAYIMEERKQNGIFTSYDNFYDRCKSRTVTTRVISTLQEHGALEFNKKKYISRVVKYNTALSMKGGK